MAANTMMTIRAANSGILNEVLAAILNKEREQTFSHRSLILLRNRFVGLKGASGSASEIPGKWEVLLRAIPKRSGVATSFDSIAVQTEDKTGSPAITSVNDSMRFLHQSNLSTLKSIFRFSR
jgi:hypothetical protein